MVASAKKASITPEERTLKRVGQEKFELSQDLSAGRDFLDAVSGRDTTTREVEKIRAQQAVQLGSMDLMDNAKVQAVDSRTASKSGVAALATSEENRNAASGAIIDADLGLSSTVDASLRSSAQSKVQLQEALLREETNSRNANLDFAGSIAGGVATLGAGGAFSSTDPLANPLQTSPELDSAIFSNPNAKIIDPFADPRLFTRTA